MSKEVVLITGGARSGKSTFALSLAGKQYGRKYFLATAEPADDEMTERIRRHREERGDSWTTIEEPIDIARVIREADAEGSVIVVDCITVWLSNIILSVYSTVTDEDVFIDMENNDIERRVSDLVEILSSLKSSSVFIVTNEVGMGIVPENRLARLFRDIAGRVNQRLAEVADSVFLMVSGIPVRIK
jgi:adenosylcobinamide kinase/adenosylcobinamide-phosphate guanylyltransferase